MKKLCKVCKKERCLAHCQDTPDAKHVPDPESIIPADGALWTVDVHCAACGISGSIRVDETTIAWE